MCFNKFVSERAEYKSIFLIYVMLGLITPLTKYLQTSSLAGVAVGITIRVMFDLRGAAQMFDYNLF